MSDDARSATGGRVLHWLRSAALANGAVVDVAVDPVAGVIDAIVEARRVSPRATRQAVATPTDVTTEFDLDGFVLLPAPAEPHTHLDKALTADVVANPTGDLLGAIDAWRRADDVRTREATIERATRAVRALVAKGTTAVRTHVDVPTDSTDPLAALEAVLEVRARVAGQCELQVVALPIGPLVGSAGARARAVLTDALLLDRTMLVGGCPHLDPEPEASIDELLAIAARHQRGVDLHMDETLDPSRCWLPQLTSAYVRLGRPVPLTASHCVSLAMQPLDDQRRIAEGLADAGISVVTLPQTNLYLQSRGQRVAPPRGLTALASLLDAGVTVAAGIDNVRDPFNPMGRADAFETASLLVTAGHLDVSAAFRAVTSSARSTLGLPGQGGECDEAGSVAVGAPAELVAVRCASLDDAIAAATEERVVWHAGRLVASTTVTTTFPTLPTTVPPTERRRLS